MIDILEQKIVELNLQEKNILKDTSELKNNYASFKDKISDIKKELEDFEDNKGYETSTGETYKPEDGIDQIIKKGMKEIKDKVNDKDSSPMQIINDKRTLALIILEYEKDIRQTINKDSKSSIEKFNSELYLSILGQTKAEYIKSNSIGEQSLKIYGNRIGSPIQENDKYIEISPSSLKNTDPEIIVKESEIKQSLGINQELEINQNLQNKELLNNLNNVEERPLSSYTGFDYISNLNDLLGFGLDMEKMTRKDVSDFDKYFEGIEDIRGLTQEKIDNLKAEDINKYIKKEYHKDNKNDEYILNNIKTLLSNYINIFPKSGDRNLKMMKENGKPGLHNVADAISYQDTLFKCYSLLQKHEEEFLNGTFNIISVINESGNLGVNIGIFGEVFQGFVWNLIKEKGAKTVFAKWNKNSSFFDFLEKKNIEYIAVKYKYGENNAKLLEVYNYIYQICVLEGKLGDILDKDYMLKKCNISHKKYWLSLCSTSQEADNITREIFLDARLYLGDEKETSNEQLEFLTKTDLGKQIFLSSIKKQEEQTTEKIDKGFEEDYSQIEKNLQLAKNKYENSKEKLDAELKIRIASGSITYSGTSGINPYQYYTSEYARIEKEYADIQENSYISLTEQWVSKMLKYYQLGIINERNQLEIELGDSGMKEKVNMYDVIKNKKRVAGPFLGTGLMLNFSEKNVSTIVENELGEKLKGWVDKKKNEFFENKIMCVLTGIADIQSVVIGGIVASLTTAGTGSSMAGARAFTMTDNLVKTVGYSGLEQGTYLLDKLKNGGNIFSMEFLEGYFTSIGIGAKKGLGIYKQGINVYGETVYIKDENGELIEKNYETFITEKVFELLSNMLIFGPVSKIGSMTELAVKDKLLIMAKDKTSFEVFGKDMTNTIAKGIGFFGEVISFTGFNTFSSPFIQTGIQLIENISNGENKLSMSDYLNFWNKTFQDGLEPENLVKGFVDNMIFIGLLKGSRIFTKGITTILIGENLESEYNDLYYKIDVKKSELLELNNKPKNYDKKGKEIIDPEFEQKFKELVELNKKMLQTMSQIVNTSKEELNKPENKAIKKYNDFLETNKLKGGLLPPEMVLNKRYKKSDGSFKDKTKESEYDNLKDEFETKKSNYEKRIIEISQNKEKVDRGNNENNFESDKYTHIVTIQQIKDIFTLTQRNKLSVGERLKIAFQIEEEITKSNSGIKDVGEILEDIKVILSSKEADNYVLEFKIIDMLQDRINQVGIFTSLYVHSYESVYNEKGKKELLGVKIKKFKEEYRENPKFKDLLDNEIVEKVIDIIDSYVDKINDSKTFDEKRQLSDDVTIYIYTILIKNKLVSNVDRDLYEDFITNISKARNELDKNQVQNSRTGVEVTDNTFTFYMDTSKTKKEKDFDLSNQIGPIQNFCSDLNDKQKKYLQFLIFELGQNLIRYADSGNIAYIKIIKIDTGYEIETTNSFETIQKDKDGKPINMVDKLKARINDANSFSRGELRIIMRTTSGRNEFTQGGGADIGFYKMKKNGMTDFYGDYKKVFYADFKNNGNLLSTMNLKVILPIENQKKDPLFGTYILTDKSLNYFTEVTKDQGNIKKILGYTINELGTNAKKYSSNGVNPEITIGENKENYIVITENIFEDKEYEGGNGKLISEALLEKIKDANNLSVEDLDKYIEEFNKLLEQESIGTGDGKNKGGNLGFFTIAQKIKSILGQEGDEFTLNIEDLGNNKKKIIIKAEIPKEYKINRDNIDIYKFSNLTNNNIRAIAYTPELLEGYIKWRKNNLISKERSGKEILFDAFLMLEHLNTNNKILLENLIGKYGKITEKGQAIIDAHNLLIETNEAKESLNFRKYLILRKALFEESDARILIENFVCGKVI